MLANGVNDQEFTEEEDLSEHQPLQHLNVDGQTAIAHQKRVSTTRFTEKEMAYLSHIKICCRDYDGLDIFQLLAINTDKKVKTRFMTIFDGIKAFLCAATQIFGILLLLVYFVNAGMDVRGSVEWSDMCQQRDYLGDDEARLTLHYNLRILSFLFSSFLAMISIDHLNNVEKGLYHKLKYAQSLKWVNSVWLRFGLSVNIVVSIIAVYGSFLVVFFSTNPLDMILNSVALFFIVELDDMLVRKKNYHKILDYIEKQEYKDEAIEEAGCCGKCLSNMSLCIGCIYTTPFQVLRYITIGLCFLIPFLVAYCY
eukprot:CAMPEP_0197021824 /NCGR_PEP_ID=MMETSP1384-20130603/2726_1 /TAXON_ID=29189 /ORGANISM="Ammonia sp." /LENGTH=309 /DNA_ID=CAMNT_0042449735 /DNA_START=23 /DNA_END=952 /DNA_ORIENTATION=+